MTLKPPTGLSHCGNEVYSHDRDHFLLALFVPPAHREALLNLYALNLELLGIHDKTSEDMIGHIRYAWWEEALDDIYNGKPPRGHPVLLALEPLIQSGSLRRESLMPLIDTYRAHFPEIPHNMQQKLCDAATGLIQSLCPESQKRWRAALSVIDHHRERYAMRRNAWLSLKLLLAGYRA